MLLCFHWNVFKVCCCVFIGKYLKHFCCFSLEFISNFYSNVVLLYVDMIYRTKWHDNFITCMVKHRPLMYNKNVKKLLKYCVVK